MLLTDKAPPAIQEGLLLVHILSIQLPLCYYDIF